MCISKLPELTIEDVLAFKPGERVTVEHLDVRGHLCTNKGTIHLITFNEYDGYKVKVVGLEAGGSCERIFTISIRAYRSRSRGWGFKAGRLVGDRVRITRGWTKPPKIKLDKTP